MDCRQCGLVNAPGNQYCTGCGAPLQEQLAVSLEDQLRHMQGTLRDLTRRIAQLESKAGAPPSHVRAEVTPTVVPPLSVQASATSKPPPVTAPPMSRQPPAPPQFAIDWDRVLGWNWLAIIGA